MKLTISKLIKHVSEKNEGVYLATFVLTDTDIETIGELITVDFNKIQMKYPKYSERLRKEGFAIHKEFQKLWELYDG